jgi:hypothetical protein
MNAFPLQLRDGHLFIELSGELWRLDTGAPNSFGTNSNLSLAGEQFRLGSNYLGLTAATLSGFVGVQCAGLLGADVVGRFDIIFDVPNNTVSFSTEELSFYGQSVALSEFMGVPILTAQIRGRDFRMFFDTGAQISYLQDDSLAEFPAAIQVSDCYPGAGKFQTETHTVDAHVGASSFSVRCGSLPGLLGMTLMMADTQGILGNQILHERKAGYFPRRKKLVL